MSWLARLLGLQTLSPPELQQLLAEGQVSVFDVNSLQSWQAARVPGARHLEPLTFTADELPPAKDAPLVFYCANPFCRKAPNAARRTRGFGYTQVRVLPAGITGWVDAGLPCESGS